MNKSIVYQFPKQEGVTIYMINTSFRLLLVQFKSQWFILILSIDTFSGSDKSLQDLFWFFSRPLLVQFKSLNGLSWFFPADISFGLDKSLQDLFWFFSRPLSVQFKSLNGLTWFFPSRHFLGLR